jgi:hypothetical protein
MDARPLQTLRSDYPGRFALWGAKPNHLILADTALSLSREGVEGETLEGQRDRERGNKGTREQGSKGAWGA